MKIVILAAGKGTRLLPLTQSTPKPLLRFGGQTILDHTFKALPAAIDEAVIVINYLGEQIKDYCGASFHGRPINYVEGQTKGTGFDYWRRAHILAQANGLPLLTRTKFLMLIV